MQKTPRKHLIFFQTHFFYNHFLFFAESLPSTPISRTSSINSDDLSNLIENLVIEKFFDTLAHQKQRRLQRKIHKNQRFPMDSTDDDGVEQIGEVKSGDEMARKTVQLYHVMVQTSKALKLCESRKEWFGSLVHVEAERLLLFACKCKKKKIVCGFQWKCVFCLSDCLTCRCVKSIRCERFLLLES